MRSKGKAAAAAIAVTAALAAAVPAGGSPEAQSSVTKVIRVGDNFYSPAKLSIKPRVKLKWVWNSGNGDTHDVFLKRKPEGVRRFASAPAATDFSFARTLKKPGRYVIICTFHEEMKMNVTVRKPQG